jgi:hypothetical protein
MVEYISIGTSKNVVATWACHNYCHLQVLDHDENQSISFIDLCRELKKLVSNKGLDLSMFSADFMCYSKPNVQFSNLFDSVGT